jgi:hypothetical protein
MRADTVHDLVVNPSVPNLSWWPDIERDQTPDESERKEARAQRRGGHPPDWRRDPFGCISYLERLTIRALSISFIYIDTCVSEVHDMRGYKW